MAMTYDQKREIRRRVRSTMLPSPTWNQWDAIPKCNTSCCRLYVRGECAWNKTDVLGGGVFIPVVTVCIGKPGER